MAFLDKVRSIASIINDKGFDSYEQTSLPDQPPKLLFVGKDGSVVEKGWEELRSRATSLVSNANPGSLAPNVSSTVAVNKYTSWIYDCVNIISRKGSTVKNYLYREIGEPDDEEFDRVKNHPLLNLINKRANKFMTGRELRQVTHMHLDLTGQAFWWIIRNGFGEPAELHPLNPHQLVDLHKGNTTDTLIEYFVFNPENSSQGQITVQYDDVVYFHYPAPKDPLIAYPPLQAISHASDMDTYLQVFEKDFFQNNARPDFIIVAEQDITEQEAKRFYETWNARHRGSGKQHKPAILNRNVRIEQLTMSAHDFEFMVLSEWIKDMILSCYGIPEAMLGLYESFNKASSITAETTFVKECLDPRLRLIEDCINMQLLPQFRDSRGLEFKFESALPKDDEFDIMKNQAELTMGLTTINAVRKKEGRTAYKSKLADVPFVNGQPLPGEDDEADKLWANMMQPQMAMAGGMQGGMPEMEGGGQQLPALPEGQVPTSSLPSAQGAMGQLGGRPSGGELKTLLEDALRTSKPGLSTLLNASRGRRGGLSGLLGNHPELHTFQELLNAKRNDQTLAKLLSKTINEYIKKEFIPEEDWDFFDIYESYIPSWEKIEEEYKEKTAEFYKQKGMEFSDVVVKALENDITTKNPLEDVDEDVLKKEFIDAGEDFVSKAARLGFNMGIKMVEKQSGSTFSPEDASKQAAGVFLDKSADLKFNTTKKTLKKIIETGLEEGLDAVKVGEMIRDEFKDMSGYRSTMIARTELAGAVDSGVDASFEQINKEMGKIVVEKAILKNAADERVCKDKNDSKNCTKNNGMVLKNYRTGKVYKESAVLHPNCRCNRYPILKE